MIRWEVKENISEYVDYLQKELKNTSRDEEVLKKMAEEFVDIVSEVIPTWNRNLIASGANPERWNIFSKENLTELEIIYTGMTGPGGTAPSPKDLPQGVWWEFGDKATKTLKRDYAYYQEFGIDPQGEAETFEGHHYVASALGSFDEDVIEYYAEDYIRQLLKM